MNRPTRSSPLITKKFDRNLAGRDFVVGDIHGAYDLVIQGMKAAKFNPACDRLFAVGDLIDRGPGSHRTARFLRQPYVHAVRGNHEDMLLQLYSGGEPPVEILQWAAKRNGFSWWLDTPTDTREAILAAVRDLPLVIEVDTPRGTVGLVHAEVPIGMEWSPFLQKLAAGDERVIESALWGRTRLNSGDTSGVIGIGRLFVGHTPQWEGMRRLANIYAVDTGATFAELGREDLPGARLTMANLAMQTVDLTQHLPASPGNVEVRDGAIGDNPFGQYATGLDR